MTNKHIVKSFDDDLDHLRSLLSQMGALVENQIADSVNALMNKNQELAQKVVKGDKKIDALEHEAEMFAYQVIARRSPMADDLREIVAALKISSILERIGDYAKNIGKRVAVLEDFSAVKAAAIIPHMAEETKAMVNDVIDAFLEHDSAKALDVWERDFHVDELNNSLFRELMTYMIENPKRVTLGTHLMFISKNIERMGDHATNIAEIVYFTVEGKILEDARPKTPESDMGIPRKVKKGKK